MIGGGCSCSPMKQLENDVVEVEIDHGGFVVTLAHSEGEKLEIHSGCGLTGC
jgi:hypothetical protein